MDFVITHDTRSVGLLNAAVLHRVTQRQHPSAEIHPHFGHEETRHTRIFWERFLEDVQLSLGTQVILCGMTFDLAKPEHVEICPRVLDEVTARTGKKPEIWTHRWPDGYAETPYEVYVAPVDIVHEHGALLSAADLELLRLSLQTSRQVPLDEEFRGNLETLFFLDDVIRQEGRALWHLLTRDPAEDVGLAAIRREFPAVEPTSLDELGHRSGPEGLPSNLYAFVLAQSARDWSEKALERLLHGTPDIAEGDVGIGFVEASGDREARIYFHRYGPFDQTRRPGLRWLLEHHYNADPGKYPNLNGQWGGPQDAPHFDSGLDETKDTAYLRTEAIELAKRVVGESAGQRTPPPSLARIIENAANEVIRELDLLRTYSAGDAPKVRVPPDGVSELIHRTNKKNELVRTLLLIVEVADSQSARWLLGHGAYNVGKLEMKLEGVLRGLSAVPSVLLDWFEVPLRLRVDVQSAGEHREIEPWAVPAEDRPVRAVSLDEARERELLTAGAPIEQALERVKSGPMILYNESELIGPSVQYAEVVSALVRELQETLRERNIGRPVEVCDVFAGSGMVARSLSSERRDINIYCIDNVISASDVDLQDAPDVTWLTIDAVAGLRTLDHALDVIALDPPHAVLFDFLFGNRDLSEELARRVRRSDGEGAWLVLYQGHTTSRGYSKAVLRRVEELDLLASRIQVAQELFIVAGPEQWHGLAWDRALEGIKRRVDKTCETLGWGRCQMDMRRDAYLD